MKLMELIEPRAILPELEASDRDGAIREMVRALVNARRLGARHADEIARGLIAREQEASNALGQGVATPHLRHEAITEIVVALARRPGVGIDFASYDGQPVNLLLLVLSPKAAPSQHVDAMECLFGHLQHDEFRQRLRQAPDQAAILDLLQTADAGGLKPLSAAGSANHT